MTTTHLQRPMTTMREAAVACDPTDLRGARSTRHSFTRQLIRAAVAGGWRIERTRFDLDADGRGTAVYEVVAGRHRMSLAVFSEVIDESRRTDRVVAEAWDVTSALMAGGLTDEDLDRLRPQVTVQEEGRALPGTLIWGRANRSARFFERVVAGLAAGRQPDADAFGLSPYLLRSTAFYSNGKFGMRDFESYTGDHPFTVPYRGHMLAAWLLREFSLDLAEHCAAARSADAVRLEGEWRRYFGLGNATGLGLVPYVINHPEILDAWVRSRERPLAVALARDDGPASEATATVDRLLAHLAAYLGEQVGDDPAPFTAGPVLAVALEPVRALVAEFRADGTMAGEPVAEPWRRLHRAAETAGPEVRGIVATVLTELTGDLDAEIEASLACVEDRSVDPAATCGSVRAAIRDAYGWAHDLEPDAAGACERFWFTSASSEEPRRGVLGRDPGTETEHGVDVARSVVALARALEGVDDAMTAGEFLLGHPGHRAALSRVQRVGPLRYGELRANLLASDFVPLDPQRLQLAVYGMDNYSPQSTDWLRVTLLSGAPRTDELAAGTADDDWMFPLRPRTEGAEK